MHGSIVYILCCQKYICISTCSNVYYYYYYYVCYCSQVTFYSYKGWNYLNNYIWKLLHAAYPTIRLKLLMINPKSNLRNLEYCQSYCQTTVKNCKWQEQGFYKVFGPYPWRLSMFLQTDFCLIINDSRRIVWYATCTNLILILYLYLWSCKNLLTQFPYEIYKTHFFQLIIFTCPCILLNGRELNLIKQAS